MLLSEAMRIGASWSKQIFGELLDANNNTCAVGSVAQVVGLLRDVDCKYGVIIDNLRKMYPIMNNNDRYCPNNCPSPYKRDVLYTIFHLNDVHKWTREKIADWIEGIEKKEGIKNESPGNAVPKRCARQSICRL